MEWINNIVNKQMVIRRFAFISTLVFTFFMYKWCYEFAVTSLRPGVDIAAILAAILTPLTTLQGFIFNFYNQARIGTNK